MGWPRLSYRLDPYQAGGSGSGSAEAGWKKMAQAYLWASGFQFFHKLSAWEPEHQVVTHEGGFRVLRCCGFVVASNAPPGFQPPESLLRIQPGLIQVIQRASRSSLKRVKQVVHLGHLVDLAAVVALQPGQKCCIADALAQFVEEKRPLRVHDRAVHG